MPNQLYLKDWTVFDASVDDDNAYQIIARFDVQPTGCPKCGVEGQLYKHGPKTTRYVDAPVHGRQTFINVERDRYRCRVCPGTFMQPLPDMYDKHRMTIRCREYIEKQALLKPNTHVAEDVGIDEKIVRLISTANAERLFEQHKIDVSAPRILGIDELWLRKEMRCIFVDLETGWPIELLPYRLESPVTNWLMHLRNRKNVEVVAIDMWNPYRNAVRYAMPQALLVVDKWHVQRVANDVMDTARRRYQSRRDTHPDTRKELKKIRGLFLRRPHQLNQQEFTDLEGWLKNRPELRSVYECKEAFLDIWKNKSAESAQQRLDVWRSTIPTHLENLFKPVVTMTRNWETEIINYFRTGETWTNARTEARNRVIKMTNRLGAGYTFDMIRARTLFGKRPGRLKLEKAAAEAARRASMESCWSCKGLYEPEFLEKRLIVPLMSGGSRDLENVVRVCRPCQRFHTPTWFNRVSPSTEESEYPKWRNSAA